MKPTSSGHVFLVRPEVDSTDVARLANAVRRRAEQQGLAFTTFRARSVRMSGEGPGRRSQFLEILDARGLYRSLHRAEVMVVTLTEVYVRRDPSRDPPARRTAMSLGEYVKHKGLFGLVRGDGDVDVHFNQFAVWRSEPPGCAGIDDPRALPFHVFEASGDRSSLRDAGWDRRFRHRYGPANRRTDDEAKVWSRATHHHGVDQLAVCRCFLPRGTHWDVSTGRQKVALRTSHEVWQLTDRPHDYVNVYPDAFVRNAPGSTARRVWPRAAQRK